MKTPPALKWLAEKRARILSQLLKAESVLEEQGRRMARLQVAEAKARQKVGRLRDDLSATDQVIRVYDDRLNPSDIAPVNGWQGRYGSRGALGDHIVEIVRRDAPQWLSTNHIEALVAAELQLTFETPALRKEWCNNSFRGRLKKLTRDGVLEHRQGSTNVSAYWRLSQRKELTLVELQSLHQAATSS